MAVSAELVAPVGHDIELCYQTFGDPTAEPLLLVMGLGGPMTWWPVALCEQLAREGFYVIRFDNRDTGRSSRARGRVSRSALVRGVLGRPRQAPYTLSDMVGDACGLLDHLGLETAHVVGISMGGMIAQTMAIERPDRVRSLVSISSTTGSRRVGWLSPQLVPMMVQPRHAGREPYIRSSLATWRTIGSPAYPRTEAQMVAQAAETFDRGISAGGVLRQMLATISQPNRAEALRSLTVPAAVIHGDQDRMVHLSGGRATAAAIPDAELVVIAGLGHDLPAELFGTFVSTIRRTADRAAAKPEPPS